MFGMAYDGSPLLWELAAASALAQQAADSAESGAAPAEAAPTAMPGAGNMQGGSSSLPTQATAAAPASGQPRQPVQAAREGLAQQSSDQDSDDESNHEPLEGDPLQAIKVSRVKAAKVVKPGCNGGQVPQWKQWPAGMYSKPTNTELQDEILLRDPKQRPASWSVQKKIDWLFTHAPPPPGSAPAAAPPAATPPAAAPAGAARGGAPAPAAEGAGTEEGGGGCWKAQQQTIRLVHGIVANKETFLKRDQKMTRESLDGAARNSAWQHIALWCNDRSKIPVRHGFFMDATHLSPDPTPDFCFMPGKCEEVFKKMRSKLTAALANFRVSGMGDCPYEEREKQSISVYSSKFEDYVAGDQVALYWYHMLMPDGLLESSAAPLPPAASMSSNDDDSRAPGSASGAKPPELRRLGPSRLKNNSTAELLASSISRAAAAPIQMSKSGAQKMAEYYNARALKARASELHSNISTAKENELERVTEVLHKHLERKRKEMAEDQVGENEAPQRGDPTLERLRMKKTRLERELYDMEMEHLDKDDEEEPTFEDDVVFQPEVAPSAHAAGGGRPGRPGRWTGQNGRTGQNGSVASDDEEADDEEADDEEEEEEEEEDDDEDE